MINLLQDCLPLQDKALQTPLHAAATKLIAGNKSDYYEEWLGQMVAKAARIPEKTGEILNATDLHGNTALHYLAQYEIGMVALRAIVDAGGDIAVRNKKKLTPMNIAMNNGCTRVIKILSTADKNSRHSSRYDSSIYTTDSPPESPVNPESLENSQNRPFLVEHPYNLHRNSSSHDTDTPVLECMEDPYFSTNEEDASDEVPSAITEDVVPSGFSDEAHPDKPSDVHSSDIDNPSSCVTSDPPADVTDDDPPGGIDNAPCGATDDTPGVANNSPSSARENAPSEVRNESFSNAPAGVLNIATAGVPDNAPAGLPDNIVPAGAPDNVHADAPDNGPAGVTDEASSYNTDNFHSATGEVPSAAYDDPDEETDTAFSDNGNETPSDNESELAYYQMACEGNAVGVQTPGIDPYSCIVHIKQEMVSPCEKCRQESMGEITTSSDLLQNATTNDLASSVVNLLKGAGLLGNLAEIAEKKRTQDEHLLTDKLEMVKETNNELESSKMEIECKKSKIEEMLLEVEELRKQVKRKAQEREELFNKRKRLNDECNVLQKKLHCCDSLLKVVPKVDSDISNS